jgi:uncharacterized protein (DUF488 family)
MLSAPSRLWSIGHSSLPLAELIALLEQHEIACIADVRRFPGSRAHPHFSSEPLARALARSQIDYQPFLELGGRRQARLDSSNTVWRHPAFRGYADYMETQEFRAGLQRLAKVAAEHRTAMMCSEALWWRCHRSMIADAMKVEGVQVLHIFSDGHLAEHPYTAPAKIVDGRLHYGSVPA